MVGCLASRNVLCPTRFCGSLGAALSKACRKECTHCEGGGFAARRCSGHPHGSNTGSYDHPHPCAPCAPAVGRTVVRVRSSCPSDAAVSIACPSPAPCGRPDEVLPSRGLCSTNLGGAQLVYVGDGANYANYVQCPPAGAGRAAGVSKLKVQAQISGFGPGCSYTGPAFEVQGVC